MKVGWMIAYSHHFFFLSACSLNTLEDDYDASSRDLEVTLREV